MSLTAIDMAPRHHSESRSKRTSPNQDGMQIPTHPQEERREAMLSVAAGWHTHLDILADRLAGRTPEGFWRRHTRLEAEYARRLSL